MLSNLFLICVMRTLFFLVLMLATFLNPLNSSKSACIFPCLLDLLLSLISCLIFLLMLGLVFSVRIFRLSDRVKSIWSSPSIVSSLRAAEKAARFNLFTCDCCRRRRMLLLKNLRFLLCCCCRRHRVLLKNFIVNCWLCASAQVFLSCAATSCLPVNRISISSCRCSTSWRVSDELGPLRGAIDARDLVDLVSLKIFIFCFLFSNPSFFFAHGKRNCAVTDLWSLPK